MNLDITFLQRCIETLDSALDELRKHSEERDVVYDIYRAACVKEFELILEQSGKLLRKRLVAFYSSNLQVDRLNFKDVFRYAAKHGLIDLESVERWFLYRETLNNTTHNYGVKFAEATLELLPAFIADAKELAKMIAVENHD